MYIWTGLIIFSQIIFEFFQQKMSFIIEYYKLKNFLECPNEWEKKVYKVYFTTCLSFGSKK